MAVVEHNEHHHGHGAPSRDLLPPGKARDPICGMTVDVATAKHRAERGGVAHHFCGAGCRAKFLADPTKYFEPSESRSELTAQKGVIYTCPMHPQIRQPTPGNCPICGMTLEPVGATADTGPSAEPVDMTRRFWIGTALAIPMLILERPK